MRSFEVNFAFFLIYEFMRDKPVLGVDETISHMIAKSTYTREKSIATILNQIIKKICSQQSVNVSCKPSDLTHIHVSEIVFMAR